ncbi:MAG: hypothetical protein J6B34_01745 [Clostridia bacterium]|nr:hypothetical protein [Clostridia bacterium]
MSIIDILLDENNFEEIAMFCNDKPIKMRQIAVIPHGENDLYCILQASEDTPIPGVGSQEGIVFKVKGEDEGAELVVEENMKRAKQIYKVYLTLLKQAGRDNNED